MAKAPAVGAEQNNAIAFAAIVVAEIPILALIEADYRIDPTRTIKVGPLVGEAQMRLDDPFSDRFEIEHAGITGKIFFDPGAAIRFDAGIRLRMHDPIIEPALA